MKSAESVERNRAAIAKWKKDNPEAVALYARRTKLKQKYGMTLEDYEQLLEDQGGVCALCGNEQHRNISKLFIDHDHETGKVRGLLCLRCNTALGVFGDNTAGVMKVLRYLRQR